jgi:hypothetical protein
LNCELVTRPGAANGELAQDQQRRTEPSRVDSLIFGSQTRVVLQASVNNELNGGTLSL